MLLTDLPRRVIPPLVAVLCLLPIGLAWAQTPATSQETLNPPTASSKPTAPPPPQIVRTDDADNEPAVTIRKQSDSTIEEYRLHGKLYMVKVTPTNGVPYYLIDREGKGVFSRQSEVLPNMAVPQWVLISW